MTLETKACRCCGKEFTPKSVVQKYCSRRCGKRYRKEHDINADWEPVTFVCAFCGAEVKTTGSVSDRRIRYCSERCAKKYWGVRDKRKPKPDFRDY